MLGRAACQKVHRLALGNANNRSFAIFVLVLLC